MPAEQRGSTYRAKTGWGLRWYENGRRRFRSGFGSKTAALAYFREEVAPRLGLGTRPDLTVTEFAERFLAAHAAEVDPRTVQTLRERLVRPLAEFGDRSLDDLARSVPDLAAWQATLPDGYRPKILGAFSQVLDRGVAWKLIRENPVRLARTDKRRVARRREIDPFTRPEIDRLAIELGHMYGAMVVFAAETGLRPGELAALEWRDVHRDAAVVYVRRVIAGSRTKEPKTERRTPPRPPHRTRGRCARRASAPDRYEACLPVTARRFH